MAETVAVCEECKGHKCLAKFLTDKGHVKVKTVGCQKVCSGPVAGVEVRGRMEWFRRVDSAKALVAMARLASKPGRPKLPKSLEKRRVAKRSGRPIR